MKNKLTYMTTALVVATLAACGGGGGGTPMPAPGTATPSLPSTPVNTTSTADPNAAVTTATQSIDLRWGIPAVSTALSNTDNVTAQFSTTQTAVAMVTSYGYKYPLQTVDTVLSFSSPMDKSTSLLQGVWITQDVKSAWAQGWTGKGVKIGIIDDFTANQTSEFISIPIATSCESSTTATGTLTMCSSARTAVFKRTHGDQVAMIAGGASNTLLGAYVDTGGYSFAKEVGRYAVVGDLNISLSSPQYGVAKDATVMRSDFLTYQSSTDGLFSVLKNWGTGTDATSQKYRELKVVNLSLGGTSTNPVINKSTYAQQLAFANATTTPDAVFVKAAGNSSCVASQSNCDPMNSVFYNSPQFKSKSLLVGALTQSNGTIASYSNTAGSYADRFVVADGRGIRESDGTYAQGTSFAAPRVSGYAAILRQKFPNLNAASTTNVILDTASWNTAWGAKSATTQAIYGQGEASLSRALAPVGMLR